MDTSLFQTVCSVPGEIKPLHFTLIQPAYFGHHFPWPPHSVSVLTGFDCLLLFGGQILTQFLDNMVIANAIASPKSSYLVV